MIQGQKCPLKPRKTRTATCQGREGALNSTPIRSAGMDSLHCTSSSRDREMVSERMDENGTSRRVVEDIEWQMPYNEIPLGALPPYAQICRDRCNMI